SNSKCINNDGSYSCDCDVGYIINPDQRTCKPCDPFFWGKDCTNECKKCVNASSCDKVIGCTECFSGWNGSLCNTDKDECTSNPCGNHSTCENLPGTYQCKCDSGYKSTTKGCEDIDECLLNTNECEQMCINTEGSYKCDCRSGYRKFNDTACEDIDECQNGIANCSQICSNLDGRYECLCYDGYNKSGEDCIQDQKTDEACRKISCQQGCRLLNNTALCFCNRGYTLINDTHCIDVSRVGLVHFVIPTKTNVRQILVVTILLVKIFPVHINVNVIPDISLLQRDV
ncbi:hypothetical protein LSH36_2231g00006, partial [Paralvinella palmiformis]